MPAARHCGNPQCPSHSNFCIISLAPLSFTSLSVSFFVSLSFIFCFWIWLSFSSILLLSFSNNGQLTIEWSTAHTVKCHPMRGTFCWPSEAYFSGKTVAWQRVLNSFFYTTALTVLTSIPVVHLWQFEFSMLLSYADCTWFTELTFCQYSDFIFRALTTTNPHDWRIED